MTAATIFTPRPPVNLFQNAKAVLNTVYEPIVEPSLFAQVDEQGKVTALRETTAVLTTVALTNTSAEARTVDFQVQSSRRISFNATVTAVAGENWLRIDRDDRARTSGEPFFAYDWTGTPPVRVVPEPNPVNDIATSLSWTSDSRYVAVGFDADRFRIYDAEDGFATVYTSPVIEASVARVREVRWSPDDTYLAVTYVVADPEAHPYVKVFDFTDIDGPVEVTLPNVAALVTLQPTTVAWGGPSDRYLFIGRAGVVVYDWDTGSPVYAAALSASITSAVSGTVLNVAPRPDGAMLAVSHSFADRLTLFTWPTATTVAKVQNSIFETNTARNTPSAGGIAWTADSRYLAVLSADSGLTPFTVYDFDSGVATLTPPAALPVLPPLSRIAWSPDGRYLVAGHGESQRYVYYPTGLPYLLSWDFDTGSPVAQPFALQGSGPVYGVAFSPDGAYLGVSGANYDRFYPPIGVDNVRLEDTGGTNHVVNGSFEDTTGLTREAFGYTAINEIPGWFSDLPEGLTEQRLFLVDRRFVNAFPTDGRVYLDVVAQFVSGYPLNAPNDARLRQNFDDLVEGQTYRLSVDVTGSGDSDTGVQVLWNGSAVTFEASTNLPTVEDFPLLSIPVPAGETVRAPLEKHMLSYGDVLQVKASGANVSAVLSYVLNTREATETAGLPASQEEVGL